MCKACEEIEILEKRQSSFAELCKDKGAIAEIDMYAREYYTEIQIRHIRKFHPCTCKEGEWNG